MKCFFLLLIILSGEIFAQEKTTDNFRLRAFQVNRNEYDVSDIKAEIEFGRGLAARILTKYKLTNNPNAQKYLSTLGAGVASMVGRPEINFHFAIIESEEVNAYACPGGYIFITRGAMARMNDEAQLVGVIAHEIGHVNERHVLKKLKIKGQDDSALSGLGALVGGATASFRLALQTIMDKAMNLLFEEGVYKSEEAESDSIAIKTLLSLNYSINSYRQLIAQFEDAIKEGKGRTISKTHPSTKSRLNQIDKFTNNNPQDLNSITNINRFKEYVKF